LRPITRAMEERERTTEVTQPRHEVHQLGPGDFQAVRAQRNAGRQAEDLHICPACDSHLVLPIDWAPAEGRCWTVDLRCPECEWTGGGTYSQAVVDRYDEVLDEGTEQVLEDLNVLSRANMEAHVDAFIAALWADQLLPEDF
jgi:hypothetical protein